ncbi:MAG: threonyl-tRNA ligase [Candidatus Nomurabacteria bacterium GW2011_GWB1_35_20]|uniref:Threonine--tRNA ligase n=2 Tax=Candidatus Nomuraibacteriota TaxID=1752729 RepID=A0A0G0H378_9BACT|nr:MAG: threonyl-tRNA ligase [Candidatus Nomurabacteria bacterium GW2011_GWB1_35_20]KKP76565.1 MAG: Threonine-tRNA ligase [Parcubacteria group bacterium GW2011_GWC1_35_21]KKP98377.1 MAG: threonyl-tRNA ligase [Candidatus Nomurabacteria bacterium GW2011_GWA1_36_15]HCY18022.1 threonine--tRNA ligase [Candidatus Nomurabacteria bacterium]
MENKNEKLHNLRHSLAHLLAAAVLKIYPDTKNTIGPSIEDGFYYDFEFSSPISDKDLPKIEKKMKEILKSWKEFESKEKSEKEAKEYFKKNEYKIELIEEIIGKGEKITFYKCGDFTDLCRGGHLKNPSKEIKFDSFKLDRVAGAYWRGNEKNKMLTRIYGLAFETKEKLDEYIKMRKEAEKRDHKKLGKELSLFTISDLVGKGLPMYLPKGNIIKTELENFIRKEKEKLGYFFVTIPHIARKELYIRSGHIGKYNAMMPIMTDEDGEEFVMKAMNCPHHFEIYNAELHSYRDLPLRIAENTTVYRNEKSGELSGLLRVKNLTQDDTHHFIRTDQIESEIEMIFSLMRKVYKLFGFDNYKVEVSTRNTKNKEKYFGNDEIWENAEKILINSAKKMGLKYNVEEGEAAFYGPKIDIKIKDSIGREWQLATIQLDFNQPNNFEMDYVGEDGKKHRVVVLHVAILGSFERFMGILIEHYAGAFPLWLSPVQIKIIPISGDKHLDYATEIFKTLKENDVRVELDESNESLSKKIRNAKVQKIPYLIIIGDREKGSKKLTVEGRNDKKFENISTEEFLTKLKKEIEEKSS